MEFTLQKCDMRGNPIEDPVKINLDISQEELDAEMAIYCDCEYLEHHPKESAEYVKQADISGVGLVKHHGWICPSCGKYVQVG